MKIRICILFFVLPFLSISQYVNLDSLIKVTESRKEDSTKVDNLFTISVQYRQVKIDYAKAKIYAEQSVQVAQNIHYQYGMARSLIVLAYCYREMNQKEEAIKQLNKAILVFESNNLLPQNSNVYNNHISCYTAIADIYSISRDFKNAENYATKALALAEKYKTAVGKCLLSLSNLFFEQGNNAESKKYAIKALADFKQTNNLTDIGRTYSFIARCNYAEDDLNSAIANYLAALDAYKQVNNVVSIRGTSYNIAQSYVKINNIDKAEQYIAVAKKYTDPTKDAAFLSFINKFSFNLYATKEDYSKALALCKDILAYAQQEKSLVNIKIAYEKYVIAYLGLKDTANAYLMNAKVSALKDSLYQADIAKNTSELAKQYETAKKEQQIIFLEKENKLNQEKLTKESQLSQALKTENLLKQAMLAKEHLLAEALTKENELKDEKIVQKIAIQNGLERENSLKKAELYNESLLNKTLQNQNTLMAEKSRNETKIRLLMIVALIGFTTIGVNYFRSYNKEKLANQQITKQSEELKVLMREVHHRVKNNLQVIVAMLRMQARRLEDKSAIEALMNSENRLQSIALVHEKLYKSNSIGGVLLKDYLQELMDVLANQFHNKVPNFTYTVNDTTNLNTNLETAIPLGMIVNELVTNSFKYAFTTTPNAIINIQFDKINNNSYQLTVTDNGPGLANGQLPKIFNGFGLKLVQLFTEQLNGSLTYSADNGSTFMVSFPAIQAAS